MMSTTSKCMKYLLFVFNFVFVLTGILLVTVGLIIRSANEEYQDVLQPDYITAPNLFIFIGVFVFFVAFFGCCGAIQENHCMIVTFSVLMSAIFVAEVTIGVTGYALRAETTQVLTKGLNDTMTQYNKTIASTQLWDDLQTQFDCCGSQNYTDWFKVLNTTKDLPMTCCAPSLGKIGVVTCSPSSPTLHKTPCLSALGDTIRYNASSIGFTGIVIAVIQLLGVAFSCTLAYKIRNNYESV